MRHILGISAFYHDSAAALVSDGRIVAAAQEERFSRRKNDERFPKAAAEFCLRYAGLTAPELDAVVFYDKPILKFARLLESYLAVAPRGFVPFLRVLPSWLGEKLNLPRTIREELPGLGKQCRILFTQHHQSHAASAFLPSPFAKAAILTVDGVGEYATTTLGQGVDREVTIHKEIHFPHSLGLLYSAFTAYCGFRVNSGEYKLMGLAPYGEPRYVSAIREHLIELKEDGSFRLNLEYFSFLTSWRMTNERFHGLFGGEPRKPDAPLEARHAHVARSIQVVTEEAMLGLARETARITGERYLCLAGGVALNCVANGRLRCESGFERIWIQPAAGDAGGALGAALLAWFDPQIGGTSERQVNAQDSMGGAFLGPEFTEYEIGDSLRQHNAVFERLESARLVETVAALLAEGKVVGWFQGRMEFGPRALGNRSILGDPRNPRMQSLLNLKVKFRESFRPFAPAVLSHRVADYFDLNEESPYMLIVAPVKAELRCPVDESVAGFDRLRQVRSSLPAVTHVDGSARIQTVNPRQNALLHQLLTAFEARTGCGVLINTSFNVRGEPVVCTPDDAYRCFVNTEMDYLAIGPFLLDRARQPAARPTPSFHPVPD